MFDKSNTQLPLKTGLNRPFSHFTTLILKLYVWQELLPLKVAKVPIFFYNLFKKFWCCKQLVNFLFSIKLSTDFYQGSYIYKLWNYEKIIFKFIVLSIALAIPGNNLSIIRETTLIKKRLVIKTYNFESNRECSKGLFVPWTKNPTCRFFFISAKMSHSWNVILDSIWLISAVIILYT